MLDTSDSQEKLSVKVEKDFIRKKVTEKDVEKWEVAQLDSNIEPRSKPTDLFEKLDEKRKIRHENLLQQLARSLYEVNLKTEKNIRISSIELKAHCKELENALQEILHNVNVPEVATYCGTVFIRLQNQANEFKSQQQRLVNELHDDLIKFENERAKENEKILHLACEEIRKNGYFLPYEVQMFVEHEALKMNKLSLNNRRCYEDLKLTLTLVTEQTFKSFMDKVFCIRESWMRQKFKESAYNFDNTIERKICNFIPEDYVRLEVKGHELKLQIMPGNANYVVTGEAWLKNLKEAMSAINDYGENLISTYKKMINAIYNGFNTDGVEIKAGLETIDSLTIEERLVKQITFNAPLEQVKELEHLEMYWQDILQDIQMYLISSANILVDAGKLWDRHTERVCESKQLILKALEKADSINQPILQDLEIKLNLSLDALRQEHNEGKLEKTYEAVVATLNLLKNKYESMYLEDVSTIEDFYKMMTLEADVLSADINEFIYELNPIEHSKIIHVHADRSRFIPDGNPLIREMELCSFRIHSVRCWKQGIWVSLETLSGRTKEALLSRTENWVSKKIENLAETKTIQMELLEKRYKRIRIEIYEKRLSEIKAHQQLFEEHKEKVKFILKKLKEEFENLIARESTKINIVKENLNEIEENALLENLPGVIRGNQITLERKKEELENDLKMAFERFRADCSTKIFDMQQANIIFMKSIRLFHENGNYSSEEGKTYITMLEELDKEINSELKNNLKDCNKEENDFIKRVGAMFTPVITLFGLLHEETFFYQGVQQRLRNFADEIREITKVLMLDFEFLKDQFYCLDKTLRKGRTDDDDSEEKFWNFVIELLYRNIRHLLYPISVPETPAESDITDEKVESEAGESNSRCCCEKKFPVNLTTSKSLLLRASAKEKPFTCKDYRNVLFNCEKPPENDGTLMAVMCNNFWEEMDFLQREACDFYKKIQGRKIIREDLIANNYDTFIMDVLAKFKYYNAQIQQFWFQIILDFLPLLGRIKTLANYFLEKKLEDYRKNGFKALENFEENFATCIQAQMCENTRELQDLDNKLLPLHGYPQNADLLNELEEEVVRRTANQEIYWEALIKKFKSQLKCFRHQHILEKLEVNKIERIFNKLRDTIFVENLGNNFLDEILTYCDNGGFCIKKISSDTLSVEKESEKEEDERTLASGEIPAEHKLNILPSKKDLHSVQTYLRQLKQIIEKERSSDTKPDTCPPCPEDSDESFSGEGSCEQFCQPKLNILLDIVDFDEPASQILESLDVYVRKLKTFAKSQENLHETELYKWLEKWKFNVKRVLKLYCVMYEEKEEKPEEKSVLQSGE